MSIQFLNVELDENQEHEKNSQTRERNEKEKDELVNMMMQRCWYDEFGDRPNFQSLKKLTQSIK